MKTQNKFKTSHAFTIVELLVVIVIIAILATITIVSYAGIREKAVVATIQSDLKNASTQIEIYKTEHEIYPTDITDCPSPSDDNMCIIPSSGNSIASYSVDNSVDPQTYSLTISNTSAGLAYKIDQNNSVIIAINGWKEIDSGYEYTCAIGSDNHTYCWGHNSDGELGNNSTIDSSTPVAVDNSGVLSGKTIKAISAGYFHTCVIASDNRVYCWGLNDAGELGNNSTSSSSIPVAVDTSGVLSGKTIKSISTGAMHTCVIASDNQVYCWGSVLGNNSTDSSSVPVAVNTSGVLSGKTVKKISTGSFYTCAIASDNLAYCWGANNKGQLGNNSTTSSLIPVAVDTSGALSGKTIKDIAASLAEYDHTCVIASDNQAYCWGINNYGQLGNNSNTNSLIPVAVYTSGVLSGKTINVVAAGGWRTCAIASDNQAYCWGEGQNGELGNNSWTGSYVPVAVYTSGVLSGKSVKTISAGDLHTCVIASDNQAYCWGANNYGQLGNDSDNNSIPSLVAFP